MRVLLSVPMNRPTHDATAGVNINDNGLGYVAAACKAAGADVTLFSWNVNLDLATFSARLRELRPALVGLKVFTTNFHYAHATLKAVREALPDAVTVIGGPHPSTSEPANLFLEFGDLLTYAIAGDGEAGMRALVGVLAGRTGLPPAAQLAQVPGLVYRDGASVKANAPAFVEDLESLPPLDWELQRPDAFNRKLVAGDHTSSNAEQSRLPDGVIEGAPPAEARGKLSALVADSRGCPRDCGHCMAYRINGSRPRKRTLEALLAELELLIRRYGVAALEFTGNAFLQDIDYARKVCEWLIAQGSPVKWGCTGGPYVRNLRDESLLALMQRAGCTVVHFGIESGSPAVNERQCKPASVELYAETVRKTEAAGIRAEGGFMLGHPDETVKEMEESIRYALSLPFSRFGFCICLPLPGTTSYRRVLEKHGLPRIDWSGYDFLKPDLMPCSASIAQMRWMFMKTKALRRFPSVAALYRLWCGIPRPR
jgi:anaerobic magnesium-protoporphyrin IX monomethyl ester cyclase